MTKVLLTRRNIISLLNLIDCIWVVPFLILFVEGSDLQTVFDYRAEVRKNTFAQSIAERTPGKSLATIQNIIDLAHRNAIKESRKVVDADLLTALEDYLYGEKKEHTPDYYKKVAIHETVHAYLSYITGDKPSYITIEARGNFDGYMQHANQEEVSSYTKEKLVEKIRTSLAGRAAEQVFFGKEQSLNTGASSDLHKATEMAWHPFLLQ